MRQIAIASSGPQLIAPSPVPAVCPVSMEQGPVPSRGDQPATLSPAVLHDPPTHHPQGKGEMASSADADRVPWTPKGSGSERPSCTSNSWKEVPLGSVFFSNLHGSGKYQSWFRSQTL